MASVTLPQDFAAEFEAAVYNSINDGNVKDLESKLAETRVGVNHVFTQVKNSNIRGLTLVHVAVTLRKMEVVRYLIAKRCDLNKVVCQTKGIYRGNSRKNRLQYTPLFTALCSGDPIMVELLVKSGADVNLYDHSLCSALWHGVDSNNLSMVETILRASHTTINDQDFLKLSPLHVSAIRGNGQIMQRLLRAGAIVDIQQIQGTSPLFAACSSGCADNVKLLLQHGSDPNLKDNNGMVALSTALDIGNMEIVHRLVSAGASVYSHILLKSEISRHRFYKRNAEVAEYLVELLDKPSSLKIQASLKIKKLLKSHRRGRSIHLALSTLPLPTYLIKYLQLNAP